MIQIWIIPKKPPGHDAPGGFFLPFLQGFYGVDLTKHWGHWGQIQINQ
jgi:hypothetical protein